MVMTDPIADMLTRLRNVAALNRTTVRMPHSKLKEAVAKVLHQEGYLGKVVTEDNELVLELTQGGDGHKLTGIKRRSKPGRREYAGSGALPYIREGLGIAIVSTSRGVMTADEARKKKLGGEVLAEVF